MFQSLRRGRCRHRPGRTICFYGNFRRIRDCPWVDVGIQPRVYLKTPNAPGQRVFLRCAASFFLEIRQYSCEKMSCSTQKSLAAGHIFSFQIHPIKIFSRFLIRTSISWKNPRMRLHPGIFCLKSQVFRNRRSIAAISARVAVPCGSRRLPGLPVRMPLDTAQRMASFAQVET